MNNRVISNPPAIKNKMIKRNQLLKLRKTNSSELIKRKIVDLYAEMKLFYFSKKKDSVRKGILPGNSRSLWSAVKIAKDTGTNEIPLNIKLMRLFRKYTWTPLNPWYLRCIELNYLTIIIYKFS